jgi:hypothetical protein
VFQKLQGDRRLRRSRTGSSKRTFTCLLIGLGLTVAASAGENGVSVYPAGVETIMPGALPPSGKTLLLEFNNFYQANGLMDGSGHSLVPGFHLRVSAEAVKVVHNWGVKALGGTLVSSVALPVLYMHLSGPFGSVHKGGIGNPDIGLLAVSYRKGDWHWWYGMDVYTPGAPYNKNDLLNTGQHYYAYAPEGAFSYLPRNGSTEFSSKLQYIVNGYDSATRYKSGREFISEYAVMQRIHGKLAAGINGYIFQQTSDDRQFGSPVAGGNRGRAFAAGPEIKYPVGRAELILKYQKEMMVQNRTLGNSFWLQIGVPLWHHEK